MVAGEHEAALVALQRRHEPLQPLGVLDEGHVELERLLKRWLSDSNSALVITSPRPRMAATITKPERILRRIFERRIVVSERVFTGRAS